MSNYPPQETLNELLEYNSKTGELTWKFRDISYFENSHRQKWWNSRFAGKPAISTKTIKHNEYNRRSSYFIGGTIFGKPVSRAKVIWIMHNGIINDGSLVSFKDKDTTNTKIENLFLTTELEISLNRRINITAKPNAYKGVCWDKKSKKWRAYIRADGIKKGLGFFNSQIEAIEERKKSELKFLHGA